jgi:hypothetical protein
MSFADYDQHKADAYATHCRTNLGIPFGRAGNAKDYAQVIFGVITVGPAVYLSVHAPALGSHYFAPALSYGYIPPLS